MNYFGLKYGANIISRTINHLGYGIWSFYINILVFHWFLSRPNFETTYKI